MIGIGTAIILLFTSLSIAAKAFRNIQVNSTDVVTGLYNLPALLIGFGGVFVIYPYGVPQRHYQRHGQRRIRSVSDYRLPCFRAIVERAV